jgi:antitoxin component YwqK of YwqJK toxin-antitoxin module
MQVLYFQFVKLFYPHFRRFFICICFLIITVVSVSLGQDTTSFYPDGTIRFKGMMKDSLKEGTWMFYYPGGPLSAKIPYDKGEFNGLAYFYDNQSNLIGLENWSNGLQEDSSWYYYPNGILEKKGIFIHSMHSGKWEFYYNNGILKRRGTYIYGLPWGFWEFYNDKGIKIQEGQFKNGLEDGNWVFFNKKGQKTYLGSFSSGKRTGTWYKLRKNGDSRIYRKYPYDN